MKQNRIDHMLVVGEDTNGDPTVACSCGGDTIPVPDLETGADVWGDHLWEAAQDAALAEIPSDRRLPWHTVTVEATTWHMAHPITCDLDECPFDNTAREWAEPPVPLGRYRWHSTDSELEIDTVDSAGYPREESS